MADSPAANSDGPVRIAIYSEGEEIPDTVGVTSVVVSYQFNRVPYAIIECIDGDPADQSFPVSDADMFIPGKKIKICAGYDEGEETIFEGVVVKHGLQISAESGSQLRVECRDPVLAMTLGRNNENYVDQKDSDIITALIGNYSALTADVDATSIKYAELVQYQCTDWDFMIARAEVNGLLVSINAGKVSVKAPDASAAEVLTVTYGEDLMSFDADVDAQFQVPSADYSAWDIAQQSVVKQSAEADAFTSQGNLTAATLAEALDVKAVKTHTSAVVSSDGLKAWAGAQQQKMAMSRVRGRLRVQGTEKALVGSCIELVGVGKRLSGKAMMTAVIHRLEGGQWITDIETGLSPTWFAEQNAISAPPASNFAPAVTGLQIGKVMKLDADPASEHRIQISLPVMGVETEGIWARLSSFSASNAYGHFCIPDIGDEVIVGYFNSDPAQPVVLGSLYSSSLPPAETITAENYIRSQVTKEKLTVRFDDEKKVITLSTPGGHVVELSDDAKTISITDLNKNSYLMSDAGITLDSPKDINLKAKGKINLDATGNIAISSKADVTAEGLNVNVTAQVGFVGKGSASAEVSASGQTTIKGAMVMIN